MHSTQSGTRFTDLHQQVRLTASEFVKRHLLPHIQDWEEQGEFPREIYQLAGEAGLLGIGYPERFGGTGENDVFMKLAASEEMMRCTSGGLMASLFSHDIALPPIVNWAKPEIQEKVVPEVLRGEKIAALAITEPGAGSDVANIQTRAVKKDGFYQVTGNKMFITSGVRADYYTVAVRTGGPGYTGISLLLIEKGTPGFQVSKSLKKTGWWASDTAELSFDDCKVPEQNLIGGENSGFIIIMQNFLRERLALSAMAYMTAEIAYEAARDYAKQRKAFGREIMGFQVTRHKLVDMATQVDIAKEYCYQVAEKIQNGTAPIEQVAMAKNFSTQIAENVTREAVQIFGGMGYMRESVVDRLSRDARILAIGGGTTEVMKELIAKQLKL
ncbi:MAG: acyl-CoA dehydrogenase family protein [Pseudomonadales bacterium]|nr:acyl-CoA dehydrogenase family protein [Pseudomonadales bacterium]